MLLRLAITLALTSPGFAGDGPFLVTDAPIFHATEHAAGAGESGRLYSPAAHEPVLQSPAVLCITVRGIDYDLEPILATKTAEWTWPGGTEASLRDHLWIAHGIAATARLPFVTLRKIHAVYHEREEAERKRATVTTKTTSTAVSNCPGGVCPAPAYRMQTTTTRRGRQWFR